MKLCINTPNSFPPDDEPISQPGFIRSPNRRYRMSLAAFTPQSASLRLQESWESRRGGREALTNSDDQKQHLRNRSRCDGSQWHSYIIGGGRFYTYWSRRRLQWKGSAEGHGPGQRRGKGPGTALRRDHVQGLWQGLANVNSCHVVDSFLSQHFYNQTLH